METKRICSSCQKTLPPNVPLGLCPECLIKSGFNTGTEPGNPGKESGFVPPPVEELRKLFPQFEIIELIGKGGMGAVYQARQTTLDRFVALKILPPGAADDAGFAERFNREARALARLNHPHIVAVHDFGQTGSQPYLVMEFVDGPNLRQVEQAGRLTPAQALEIVPQICEALQFAHNEGVVHRDIKPENILLDKKGRVKITDFGIAKILGVPSGRASLTGAKDFLGTPHYMAPEQVEKPQTVDHRADIYSLGVVFYELLTGELPLGKFAVPSKKVHMDVRLDEVVLHALEKEPALRYQHASEVKTDVETIASTSPPSSIVGAPAAAPSGSPQSPEADGRAAAGARSQAQAPAIGILIVGVLNFLLLIAACASQQPGKALVFPFFLVAGAITGLVIVGALQMWRSKTYALAVAASIFAMMIPPACFLGFPLGIWALVVLSRQEVRDVFGKGYSHPLEATTSAAPPPPRPDRFWRRFAVAVAAVVLALILIPVGSILLALMLPALSRASQPWYVVAGTVSEADTGKPIVGARVADNRYGADASKAPREAWTAADGRYTLRTWPEEHTIAVSAPGYETKLAMLSTSLWGRERKAHLDFQLQPTNTSAALAFGPVLERVVANMIDFDSGALVDLPQPAQPGERDQARYDWINGEGQGVPWMRAQGIDAIDANHGLIGVDLLVVPLESRDWHSLTPAGLRSKLDELQLPAAPSSSGIPQERRPFGFQTREGALGIFEITDANLPRGVKIRYKLVQAGRVDSEAAKASGAAEHIAAQATPGEYKLTLTNGVAFEVEAVTRNPRKNQPWWKPDGTPLPEPLGRVVSIQLPGMEKDVGERDCAILFRYNLPADLPVEHWQRSQEYTPAGQTLGYMTIEPGDRATRVVEAAGTFVTEGMADLIRFPASANEATVHLRMASGGPWEPVAIYDGVRMKLLLGGVDVLCSDYRPGEMQKCLDVTHDLDREIYALRMFVVYRDGRRQEADFHSGFTNTRPTKGAVYGRNLRFDDIKEFVLERTPWVRGKIRNIALRPKLGKARAATAFSPVIERVDRNE